MLDGMNSFQSSQMKIINFCSESEPHPQYPTSPKIDTTQKEDKTHRVGSLGESGNVRAIDAIDQPVLAVPGVGASPAGECVPFGVVHVGVPGSTQEHIRGDVGIVLCSGLCRWKRLCNYPHLSCFGSSIRIIF